MTVRSVTILIVSLFAAYIIGCDTHEDIDDWESDNGIGPEVFPNPPSGEIAVNAIITVTFWNAPENLTVEDVGWIGRVNGERQAILELVKGKELACGTTYIFFEK